MGSLAEAIGDGITSVSDAIGVKQVFDDLGDATGIHTEDVIAAAALGAALYTGGAALSLGAGLFSGSTALSAASLSSLASYTGITLSTVGALTGDETLQQTGTVLAAAGGIGSMAAGAGLFGGSEAALEAARTATVADASSGMLETALSTGGATEFGVDLSSGGLMSMAAPPPPPPPPPIPSNSGFSLSGINDFLTQNSELVKAVGAGLNTYTQWQQRQEQLDLQKDAYNEEIRRYNQRVANANAAATLYGGR